MLDFEDRTSESPFVERVWHRRSIDANEFTSMAFSHWQLCVWTNNGKTTVTLRGPETKPTTVLCPPDTYFLGIVFKLGTIMPHLPASHLVDKDLHLPEATSKTFYLKGSAWQFPDFENADTFVERMVREELLVKESVVDTALQGVPLKDVSLRSVQRRFAKVTGLSHAAIHQIERARLATILLKEGVSILDTVEMAGYADQPHLTRSLKRYIGLTAAQLIPENGAPPLSYLFKTATFG
jgi:hypothetical protein